MIIKFKIFERSIYTEDFINDILDKDEISDDDKLILDQVATDDKDIKELIKELHNNMLKCRDINKQMEDYIRTHSDNEKPLELLDQLTDIWDEQTRIENILRNKYRLELDDFEKIIRELGLEY